MMRINKATAIRAIAPGAQFVIIGDVIEWHSADIPQPTEEEITAKITELQIQEELNRYTQAIQSHIEKTARSKQYDSATTLASYIVSKNQTWASEAEIFLDWRDDVWNYTLAELEKFQSGERSKPTIQEFIAELPVIDW